jgi:hypothetical protein
MGTRFNEDRALIIAQNKFIDSLKLGRTLARIEPGHPLWERSAQAHNFRALIREGAIKPELWVSSDYLVQVYADSNPVYPGLLRLSVSRTKLGADASWIDGVAWDELQAIKAAVGYGDRYAIEVYPRDEDLVNVANMRHLWILPEPLSIGWFK